MNYGICLLNAIPLRIEPNHRSEMISQVLFGELFKILEKSDGWVRIILDEDNYEGWVSHHQIKLLSETEYIAASKEVNRYCHELVSHVQINEDFIPISLGAKILSNERSNIIFGKTLNFECDTIEGCQSKQEIVKTAYYYLNSPHLWGGKTPFGIDAPGFTQMVYRINGYPLLREAYQQASQGEVLSFIEESEPGDLAFFDDEEGNIIHTGIILRNHNIIHCWGEVRIDKIDHSGIFNVRLNKHTHNLRVIKQIFK
ncbi:C40 family peptidase [Namhaeicola litoreus]|uniref:NlpC/P60 family protein n=1 Tax=Namhaeicola litoreus TaxID=1052145 RepID=A0ABW3Y374_9FLAO